MQNTGHEFVITLRTASKAIADKHKMLLFLLKIGFFLHIESHRNTLSERRYLEYKCRVMSLITFKPLQGESASYQATWPPIELSSDSGKTQESPLQWLIAISIIIIIINQHLGHPCHNRHQDFGHCEKTNLGLVSVIRTLFVLCSYVDHPMTNHTARSGCQCFLIVFVIVFAFVFVLSLCIIFLMQITHRQIMLPYQQVNIISSSQCRGHE